MPGESYSFSKEAAKRIIQAAKKVLSGGDLDSIDNSVSASGLQCITAKLLAQIGGQQKYTWHQERRTATSWETISNPLTDGGKYPAYNLDATNTNDLSAMASTQHVVLCRGTVNDGGTIKPCWHIVGTAAAAKPHVQIRESGDWIQISNDNGVTWENQISLVSCSSS